jgi:hypothetical protein
MKLHRAFSKLIRATSIATTLVLVLVAMSCSRRGVESSQAAQAAASSPSADPVRITMFYASPAQPPEATRCFQIPTRPATYTLTAERGNARVSQSVTVEPVPPKVKLLEVSINKLDFAPGEKATVCYKARNAVGVTINPGAWIEPHRPDLGCVSDQPKHSTTYVVIATGARGETDSERVTARVK